MQRKPLASINITPLVDVLLILLVIVMLAMPMFVKKLPVQLPQTGVDSAPAASQTLRLSLGADNTLYKDEAPITLGTALAGVKADTTVELAVDQKVPYGKAAQLIAKLQDKKPRDIVLLTQ